MYAVIQDIIDRYGESELWNMAGTDDTGDLQTVLVEQVLSDASDEIDAHLCARYDLPLQPVPGLLRRICVDIAVSFLPANSAEASDIVESRAKAARQLLLRIVRGEIELGIKQDCGPAMPVSGGVYVHQTPSPFAGLGR